MCFMRGVIEEIKGKLKLEEIIAETLTVIGRGHVLTTSEHDSLKIFVSTQTWHRFSTGEGGDVFDWWQAAHKCDFRAAMEVLAAKAGVTLHEASPEERKAAEQERSERKTQERILGIAAAYYHDVLRLLDGAQVARDYCHGRGWTDETILREQIGYVLASTDKPFLSAEGAKPLYRQLQEAGLADHAMAKAVLSIPAGMIVYVHRDERGLPVYLSGRSVVGKRHYNLPGEKRVYTNTPAGVAGGERLLVEGQADAISLGQLGLTAVALCGVDGERFGAVSHVALDNDKAGQAKALELALGVDPLCQVVTWPATQPHQAAGQGTVAIKDANDLLRAAVTANDIRDWLESSPRALAVLAEQISHARGEPRKALIERFFGIYCGMDEMVAMDLKPELAQAMKQPVGQFNRLLKAHKDKERKEEPAGLHFEYSAGGAQGGYIWEQCITWTADGKGQTLFALRLPDGKIKYEKTVDMGGVSYIPYQTTLGLIRNRRIVLFPERAEEYGSEKALNEEIRQFIHDFLDVDPFYERLASYYVMFSWLYDLFENLPYLRALGDYGTGKTRFIQTIGVLCYRPMLVSGASSVSPIFRLIDMFRGTLVVDEADLSNSDSDNEIVKIINVGYQKGGAVMRAEKDPKADIYAPEVYDVFGPKILATRKPFTDRAVESRCLTRRTTTQRPRADIPYTLGEGFWRRSQTIRNKLLMYRLRNWAPVEIDHSLADTSVEPRLNQVTMALKSIIKDEGMRQDIDMFIRAYNGVLINDRQMTLPAVVLQALVDIHYSKKTNLLGQDERDFTMKGITERCKQIMSDIDPDTKIYPRLTSKTLSDDLGLPKRVLHPVFRRDTVAYEEEELKALMLRFGIEAPQQI